MKTQFMVLAASVLLSFNAFAMSLQEAKSQGLVGEQANGYLGIVVNDPQGNALAEQVNAKRKTHYQKIANSNGLSANEVAKLAGEKVIKAATQGEYIQTSSGKWIKK